LDEPVVIRVVPTEQEADVISGLLQDAGIESLNRQTNLGAGASDGLTVIGPYEVVIGAQDAEAARDLLASAEEGDG
jgi:hypothetical protein